MHHAPSVNSLDGRTDRAKDDREIERPRLLPLVGNLELEPVAFIGSETLDVLECGRVLGCECAALEEGKDVVKILLAGELLNVGHQLVLRDAEERILDPMRAERKARMSAPHHVEYAMNEMER